MKKTMMMALMMMGVVTMTSCGDDVPDQPHVGSIDRCEVVVDYEYSQEFLTFYDVKLTAKDFAGGTIERKVTSPGMNAFLFYSTSKQGEGSLKIDYSPKADAEKAVADSSYNMVFTVKGLIRLRDKKGVDATYRSFGPGVMHQSVRGAGLNNKPDALAYHIGYVLKYDMDNVNTEANYFKDEE